MPELPEVETTRRGIAAHVEGETVRRVVVRQPQLRWRVPSALSRELPGKCIRTVRRRAKYLLLDTRTGTVLIHLGMSGSLRVVPADLDPGAHDHLDIVLASHQCLRLRDPRRFGAVLWTRDDPARHPRLASLGVEPLEDDFDGHLLYAQSRNKRVAVKSFLMNSHIVVGIGNIYASEALFMAGIHPHRAAGRIALPRYARLADCIKEVLRQSIRQGGTTLRDFVNNEGKAGYFQLQLRVYGKEAEDCLRCGEAIRRSVIGQRSTFYCVRCQR